MQVLFFVPCCLLHRNKTNTQIALDSTTGAVSRVKLSYATSPSTTASTQLAHPDDDSTSALLTAQLSSLSFSAFNNSIATLAVRDSLYSPGEFDAFKAIAAVERDLKTIYVREANHAHQQITETSTTRSNTTPWTCRHSAFTLTLMNGHGVCLVNFRSLLGVSLVYWVDRAELLDVVPGSSIGEKWLSSVVDADQVFSARVAYVAADAAKSDGISVDVLESYDTHGYLVVDDEMNVSMSYEEENLSVSSFDGLQFSFRTGRNIQSGDDAISKPVPQAAFCLEFHPPVPSTRKCHAELLSSLSKSIKENSSLDSQQHHSQISKTAAAVPTFLESLYTSSASVFAAPSKTVLHAFRRYGSSKVRISNNVGNDVCVLIETIPFAHPSQVLSILKAVRRQVTFNTLVKSCFAATAEVKTLVQIAEIVQLDSPHSILMNVVSISTAKTVQVKILVEDNGVKVVGEEGQVFDKFGVVLDATLDFGVALEYI
ncbi:hypothetical protein HK100_008729 [Physocladia obscura]|uniref:Mediator of RNA polymerase II transcription subunit 1 n=1 Tax=Physocladia obscura TaxID=109957 RepID=A0AAD5TF50_9FUNG|nr:hypothetical protein HK100_008729 [Physocladia obscura]